MDNFLDVADLLERLSRVLQNEAHADGLKPTQWEALRFLARANRFSRTPSGLTAYLGTTKGTVSQTLSALERKGLVAKTVDAQDRRQVQLDLTADGAQLLKRDPVEILMRPISKLPARERDALADRLQALLTETLQKRDGRPFGVCRSCRFFQADAPAGVPHRCGLLDVALSAEDSTLLCVEQEPAPGKRRIFDGRR